MNRFRKISSKLKNIFLILVLATGQIATATGPFINNLQKASAAGFSCTNDTAGANDEPGQKDLTKMCVDYDNVPNSVSTTWNWDDLGTSGSNTLDACNLFDTDGDGKINYAVCVTTQGNPATIQTLTTYSCTDTKIDRCQSPNSVVASGTTTCGISSQNTDPFPAGDVYPADIQGACTIQLATVGGASATLIDVCSYPSQQPNSDPSDCIIFTSKNVALIEIIKDVVPNGNPGLFNLSVDGPQSNDTTTVNNLGDNGTTGIIGLTPPNNGGTSIVSETAGNNTSLTNYSSSISCVNRAGGQVVASGNGTSLQVPTPNGSNIICTVTNTAAGSITIVKNAIPDDSQDFAFTSTGSGTSNFSLDNDADETLSDTKLFSNLVAGTYTFTEANNSGWYLDGIDCPNITETQNLVTRNVSLTITAGQDVTCTFTNRKLGQIVVTKQTDPNNDPTQFSITASPAAGVTTPAATQPISDNQSVTYTVKHGTYDVNEAAVSGWAKDDNQCQDLVIEGNTPLVNGIPTRTCTINNTKLATLNILKDALPDDAQDFNFTTSNLGGAIFNLDDDADGTLSNQQTFNNLVPGQVYSVTEQSLAGWSLTGLSCNNVAQIGSTATVTPTAGQVITCTFTNTKLRSISGIKYTSDADGGFGLVLSDWTIFIDSNNNGVLDVGEQSDITDQNGGYSFLDLLPGNYILNEILAAGWTQIFGPDPVDLTYNADSTGNDFGNFQNGSISGFKWNDKNADDVINSGEEKLAGWTITLYDNEDNVLDIDVTDGSGNYDFINRAPGDYSVCETQQAGWVQTYPNNNACHPIAIDESGETNEANFGNQGRGNITVIKNVDTNGDGDLNDAEDVVGAIDWTWDIADGAQNTATGSSQNISAGTYTVSEDQKDNFHVTSVVCGTQVNAVSTSAQVVVIPGANVTCTFVNTRDTGSLTIIKHVINDNNGTASASNFTMRVKQNNVDVSGSPTAGSETGTAFNGLATGSYTVSEDTPVTGYEQTSIVCDGQPTITVTVTTGAQKTCTITNDDMAPTLTLVKQVTNDNSGESESEDWTLTADPAVGPNINGDGTVTDSDANANTPYLLSESGPSGYHIETDWDCIGNGGTFDAQANTITLALNADVTCTIVNDDDVHPGISLVKSGPANAHEGDEVTYSFSVENIGDEPLSGVEIGDPLLDNMTYVSGDTNDNQILDVVETWQFTATYVIPANQIADVYNEAGVCADPRVGEEVCDEDDHTIDVLHPAITVEKSGPLYAYEGQLVGYSFVVTNTGDTTLYGVNIIDDIATNETCETSTLVPSQSTNCTAIYIIPAPTEENVINNVDACGTDILQLEVCNDDHHELDVIHPSINIIKTGPSVAHEGDTVTYTFTVTNTGDTPLSNTTVADNIAGTATYVSGDTNTDTKLDTLETWIFTADYVIPAEQNDDVVNTATACGYDPIQAQQREGEPVCDDDTHELDVLHPSIEVEKTASTHAANPGDVVTYTFTVTNIGDTPLSITTVNDDIAGDGVYQAGDTDDDELLDLGEIWIYTADHVIPTSQRGNVHNTVIVCGEDELEGEDCDDDVHKLFVYAKVVVTKYNDYNRNSVFDTGDAVIPEPTLPGWCMTLSPFQRVNVLSLTEGNSQLDELACDDASQQTTGQDGVATFTDVLPNQSYNLDEILQTGWNRSTDPETKSNIYCVYSGEQIGFVEGGQYIVEPGPGDEIQCSVGNYREPVLNLEKSNNRPNPTVVGDTVTYTLIASLPEDSGALNDVTVTDLPPEGFVYVPSSATTTRGSLTQVYGSPGIWTIGDMLPGESVTMTYQAKITSGVSDGTYPDVAFAQGCAPEAPYYGDVDREVESEETCDEAIYSNVHRVNTPFVDTKVTVGSPQVLAATILVNTGAPFNLTYAITAITLMLIGVATAKRRNPLKGGAK